MKSHVSMIRGLDVSNDGKYLLSGSRDKVANLWDLNKKKLVKTFPIYEVFINHSSEQGNVTGAKPICFLSNNFKLLLFRQLSQ